MRQPATCNSRQGLLLVEAVLAAVVIAVGLTFISRGLGSQLRAVRTIEEQETLTALAHGALLGLEARFSGGSVLSSGADGSFDAPYDSYRWSVEMGSRSDEADAQGEPLASDVFVTVEHDAPPSGAVTLGVVWPQEWLSP